MLNLREWPAIGTLVLFTSSGAWAVSDRPAVSSSGPTHSADCAHATTGVPQPLSVAAIHAGQRLMAGDVNGTPISSPDGNIQVIFELDESGAPFYRIDFKGHPLIGKSRLGLNLEGVPPFGPFKETAVKSSSGESKYSVPFGKTSSVDDHYREYTVTLKEVSAPGRELGVAFRVYNDGAAFQYLLPPQNGMAKVTIAGEMTQVRPAGDPKIYSLPTGFASAYENHYQVGPLAEIPTDKALGLPLAMAYPNHGPFVTVSEAGLKNYANLYLGRSETDPGTLESRFPPDPKTQAVFASQGTTPSQTPWRTFTIGDSEKATVESNLINNLSRPSVIQDTSWIHTGKCVFPWWNGYVVPGGPKTPPSDVLNGDTLEYYIDFAAKNKIECVSVDGYEFDKAWYGGKVIDFEKGRDITQPAPEMRMPAILKYAKDKHVGLRLWMHSAGLNDENLDRVFKTFHEWGVPGIMVDFLGDDTQRGVAFDEKMLQTAAKYHLTVCFHGIAKPTGLGRTYPNLLTEEGVMGLEYNKWKGPNSTPDHEINVAFIRCSVGPCDTHEGSFRPVPVKDFVAHSIAPNSMGTLARELAMYVVYENHQPMLADYPAAYEKHPAELKFLQQIPVTWDETRLLNGSLEDQVVTMARRKGRDWYLGSMNGNAEGRNVDLPLGFLGSGKYVAEIYEDTSASGSDGEQIAVKAIPVTAASHLSIPMAPSGGQVVRIRKAN
jgi:alpha-glucosidase